MILFYKKRKTLHEWTGEKVKSINLFLVKRDSTRCRTFSLSIGKKKNQQQSNDQFNWYYLLNFVIQTNRIYKCRCNPASIRSLVTWNVTGGVWKPPKKVYAGIRLVLQETHLIGQFYEAETWYINFVTEQFLVFLWENVVMLKFQDLCFLLNISS